METINAFEFTLTKVWELKESGIEVIIKPSRSSENKDIAKRYSGTDRVPAEKWLHVTFHIKNGNESKKVLEMAQYLAMCGICFDTGGCSGQRDWELDWSFSYKKGEEDMDMIVAREQVEEMLLEEMNKEDSE